jgi:hypothetical protein
VSAYIQLLLDLVCIIALFKWKKWGFWGYCILSIITVLEGFFANEIIYIILPFLDSLILFGVLQIGKENQGWSQLY